MPVSIPKPRDGHKLSGEARLPTGLVFLVQVRVHLKR